MPFWSKRDDRSRAASSLSPDEVINLARRYVVQETVGPLKKIAKVLGIGLGGAVVAAIGSIIVLIGVLRVLQTETGNFFAGTWTFAPYLLTVLVGAALVAAIAKGFWSALRVPPARPESTEE
jgi:hypothetical protein